MYRLARKVILGVDALEERCTPAALLGTTQPAILPEYVPFLQVEVSLMPTLAPVQLGHNAAQVRTDLFGGAYGTYANSPADDPLASPEPLVSHESAFDLQPQRKSEAELNASPAAPELATDDAPTRAVETEPIALCVVVEYD